MLTISVVVPLRVMCLFSLADFKIYGLVCIEFSITRKNVEISASFLRFWSCVVELLLDLHVCARWIFLEGCSSYSCGSAKNAQEFKIPESCL